MSRAVLVLNAGSSSLKFGVYAAGAGVRRHLAGAVEDLGRAPRLVARDASGAVVADLRPAAEQTVLEHVTALEWVARWLAEREDGRAIAAVGHRVVHGGPDYAAPVRVTPAVLADLDRLVPLAPLHQPENVTGIRAVESLYPGVPQVACFDTAFHRSHPWEADRYALPDWLYAEGIRRYGFHGLSYAHIARVLPDVAPEIAGGRVVVAHLGGGASMCALRAGRSVDSTMGFTALDGLPMGTRCGALDPGVPLHLMAAHGMSPGDVADLLYRRSGLLGLSGISGDMRTLLASDDPRAARAVEYYVYRIGRELGALAAVLGGLDGLVFTAGVGENAVEIRARVCRAAAWLGITLDEAANAGHGPRISAAGSDVSAWVVPTDEEGVIARETWGIVGEPAAAG